jgi:hypothetical protein
MSAPAPTAHIHLGELCLAPIPAKMFVPAYLIAAIAELAP